MSKLLFDASKCVRSVSKFSNCTACVDICPVNTMFISSTSLPSFVPNVCVDCGGCMGACPSEALSLANFSTTDFIFEFFKSEDSIISCKNNIPCLSILSAEHLVSLALLCDKPFTLDLGHCYSCSIKEPLYEQILKNVEEANYILEAIESKKHINTKNIAYVSKEDEPDEENRREFLSIFSVKGILQSKKEFDAAVDGISDEALKHEIGLADVAKIRNKNLPDKRKILFMALKRAKKPELYHTIVENEISFASQKFIDMQKCNNCQMCYRICPTGALSSDTKNSKIFFDAMMCIKCRVCHDTCEPDALQLQPVFELKEFFEPTQRTLAAFKVAHCHECGAAFTSLNGEKICPRCKVEEDEALDLWNIKDDGKGNHIFETRQEDEK